MNENDGQFISADSHIYEPEDLWTNRMESKWRSRAPRIDSRKEGDYYVVDGVPPVPVGVDAAILEQKIANGLVEDYRGYRHSDGRAQASDPQLRLRDQELDNVRAEVIYPNTWEMKIYNAPDVEYGMACVRTYNDWLAEFVSQSPRRLIGCPLLLMKGPLEWDVQEAKRLAKMGFRTVHIPVDVPQRPYSQSGDVYEPLWATLEDLGLVVALHAGSTTADAGAGSIFSKYKQGINWGLINATGRMTPQILGHFLSGAICQRYPRLRFVMVECGLGWIPSVLRFMEKFWSVNRKWMEPKLDESPRFYFDRQMYATFEGAREDLTARLFVNPEHLLWGNDYPHVEGTFPSSKREVGEHLSELSPLEVRKLTHDNAAALYGL